MYAAEIEESHVQMNGSSQMFERLAESKAQPCEAAQVRPHTKICALHMGGADLFELGISADWDRHNGFDVRGVVPLRTVRARFAVELEQLREIYIRTEVGFHRGTVPVETVRCDLESPDSALTQIADKFVRVGRNTLSEQVGNDQFGFRVNRHPHILIAPLSRNVAMEMGFFRVNERPEFIGLHESRTDASHQGIGQVPGLLADCQQERENRALVRSSDTRDRADAHAFEQERHNLCSGFSRDVVASEGLLSRLGESSFAGRAAKTLDSLGAVESKSFRFGVLATYARHGLLFLREKPYNQSLGSECGLRPRLDSAPSVALTIDGAFSFHAFKATTSEKITATVEQILIHDLLRAKLVSGLPVPLDFDYVSLLFKTINDGVNANKGMFGSFPASPSGLKLVSNFHGSNRSVGISDNLPNRFRESHRFFGDKRAKRGERHAFNFRFFTQSLKSDQNLCHAFDALINFISLPEKVFQFLLGFEHCSLRIHTRRLYELHNSVKRKVRQSGITLTGWDDAINEAKRQLSQAQSRVIRLRVTLRNFQRLKKAGQKWPGESSTQN